MTARGNPGMMTDVNARQTAFTYDGRNRLLTTTFEGIHTSRTFTPAGEVDTITAPGSRTLTYTYDPVYGRLSRITDNQGSYHYYDYDANGNLIEQSIYNNADVLQKQTRFDYQHPDYPGRLWKIIQPDDSEIIYGYDAVGNVNAIENERLITTTYSYDPLNRLEQVIQPDTIVTDYGYDNQDNLTLIQDPGSNATNYVLDDYGRILSETSPDRGETIYVYDLSSNQVAVTHANGTESVYTYDVLNRLVSVAFPDTSQNLTYEYDTGTDGMGRLTGITDPGGQSTFIYSTYGSIAGQTRMQTGLADAVTSFGYDPLTGDRASMTYPSGLALTYQYDSTGRPLQVLADGQPLASDITYMPFGPVKSFSFGEDVVTVDKTYTQRYQIERILAGDMDFNYQYYPDGTVQTITGVPSIIAITSSATDFFYQTGSNRLDYSTGTQAKTYTTDNHGNIISDGTLTYIYNQNNRLTEVKNGSTTIVEYVYDAFQRRVKKITSGTTICYHYDDQNRLISETDGSGNPLRDYVYLGDTPVAMKLYGTNAGIYYMVTDHLGTPQQIFDNTGTTVWEAAYLPFGSAQIRMGAITCNLRFPGQYFDAETGLHYNWHRYYDPETGRYLTPDPIGLEGGINPFVYVLNDPINGIDPLGLRNTRRYRSGERNPYATIEYYSLLRQARQIDPSFSVLRNSTRPINWRDVQYLRTQVWNARMSSNSSCPTTNSGINRNGFGNIGSQEPMNAGDALRHALNWLGPGYREIGPHGSGVYRSVDNLRQFRMTNGDLTGTHGNIGAHVHFEILNFRGNIIENNHVPILP